MGYARLSQPTLAFGEHGAPVQGLRLVAKGEVIHTTSVQGWGFVSFTIKAVAFSTS